MAQFLTTHGVASEIEQVIMGAQGRLVLVTPFLKLSAILLERLQDAGRRRVLVSIVYGKAELSDRELAKLGLIPRLDLRFCENLHAKCYCNDVAMVVTSMNLHEFSEKNNREVGVLLTADEQPYRDGLREVESILANSSVVSTVPAQAAPIASGRIAGSRLQTRDLVISRVGAPIAGKNPHVVCQVDGIGRIAFWGRRNMDLLRSHASHAPFGVRCRCRGSNIPDHDAWVPENQELTFIAPATRREV